MKINEKEMSQKIGLHVIDFQEKILKEISKLKKNPDNENFKSFRKKFKDEVFSLYCSIDEPFLKASSIENAKIFLSEIFEELPTKAHNTEQVKK
jgi:hypothetical protein